MPREPASAEQLAWERTIPLTITADVIWKLDVYRSALFLSHVAVDDCGSIRKARPNGDVAAQLLDAAASVSAHIGEGYDGATRADRLRILGYALGSLRECISRYLAASDVLGTEVLDARLALIARTRAMLVSFIASIRERAGERAPLER